MADTPARLPLVVANWKMNLVPSEAADYVARFEARAGGAFAQLGVRCEVALAPAFPALDRLGRALRDGPIGLAAQNVHAEPSGAFTGEVSLAMLEDLGCDYVLLGHSERRQIFGETDEVVAAKAARVAGSSVRPLLCIGETLDERERDETLSVVERQLIAVLDAAGDGIAERLVVAYEPVWAIGTGRTATPEIAQTVHAAIRATLVTRLGAAGRGTRILYGGSVKPGNAASLVAQPDIDGALVGGAGLEPGSFAEIVLACLETH
jgi:triosephosphate isomerase